MITYTLKAVEACSVQQVETTTYDDGSTSESSSMVDGTRVTVSYDYGCACGQAAEVISYKLATEDAAEITSHVEAAASARAEIHAAKHATEDADPGDEPVKESSIEGLTIDEAATV